MRKHGLADEITMTDFFCGGGGSSEGAEEVPGVKVIFAANHWKLAVDTHNTNKPHADHDCADLSQVEPSRYPTTTGAWFSPECTNHSQAKGAKRTGEAAVAQMTRPDAEGNALPVDAAERSRSTMWDVVRFSEYHRYKFVIVENVVEAADWLPFHGWLMAMNSLGYDHHIVYLNSMHAQSGGDPAAQSRDRMYVNFWLRGNTRPNLEKWTSPRGFCASCDRTVDTKQVFKATAKVAKHGGRWGRYGQQYTYNCVHCAARVEPAVRPALDIVDLSIPGQRIGDRDKPLADKTRGRIAGGLKKFAGEHLLVPVEGRDGKSAQPLSDPMRALTTRAESAVAFIAELRGGGSDTRSVGSPLATVTASGNHHAFVATAGMLMRNNGSLGDGAEHCTSLNDVARTMTTKGHQSVVTWDAMMPYNRTARLHSIHTEPTPTMTTVDTAALLATAVDVDDCYLRMLTPPEVKMAMAFPGTYVLLGNKREQVRMAGNAVTPPCARDLVAAHVEALRGSVAVPTHWERELLSA